MTEIAFTQQRLSLEILNAITFVAPIFASGRAGGARIAIFSSSLCAHAPPTEIAPPGAAACIGAMNPPLTRPRRGSHSELRPTSLFFEDEQLINFGELAVLLPGGEA